MTDGMTKEARKIQLLDSGLSAKIYKLGNPFVVKLKHDGEDYSDIVELFRRQTSKKSF